MKYLCLALILLNITLSCFAQHAGQAGDSALQLLDNYGVKVQARVTSIDAALTKKTSRHIDKLSKLEARLVAKSPKIDPSKTRLLSPSPKLQGNVQVLYDALYSREMPRGQAIRVRVGYDF